MRYMIGQILATYINSVTIYANAADSWDHAPSNKIHPVQKEPTASVTITNHIKLVRECKKPVPHAQLQNRNVR
jgi:hypothetical protein